MSTPGRGMVDRQRFPSCRSGLGSWKAIGRRDLPSNGRMPSTTLSSGGSALSHRRCFTGQSWRRYTCRSTIGCSAATGALSEKRRGFELHDACVGDWSAVPDRSFGNVFGTGAPLYPAWAAPSGPLWIQ